MAPPVRTADATENMLARSFPHVYRCEAAVNLEYYRALNQLLALRKPPKSTRSSVAETEPPPKAPSQPGGRNPRNLCFRACWIAATPAPAPVDIARTFGFTPTVGYAPQDLDQFRPARSCGSILGGVHLPQRTVPSGQSARQMALALDGCTKSGR